MQDKVILLHGIFNNKYFLYRGEKYLKSKNYKVLNFNYPSITHKLEDIIEIINEKITKFNNENEGKIHFVGYSMGGLLIRAYLSKYKPNNLGRVAMIGTPNKGSEIADFFQNLWIYKLMFGPAGQQLITDQTNFKSILQDIDYEVGVVAGNKSYMPFFSKRFGKPNDNLVSVESAIIEGQENIILPLDHLCLPFSKKTWIYIEEFLRTGKFDKK